MEKIKESLRKEEGLSLVEIIVSIFILSLLVTSVSAAFIFSIGNAGNNEIRMHALNIANEEMEKIRSLNFAEIGTKKLTDDGSYIYGDPGGEILEERILNHNGMDYKVNIRVNWEEEADWDLGSSADWDYKSVSITATPVGRPDLEEHKQTFETYVTRDHSQPALTGANIRLRTIRGWKKVDDDTKVASNINIVLASGPSAPKSILTSSNGVASFLNLSRGRYAVEIRPESAGYMLHPTTSSTYQYNLSDLETVSEEIEVEKPCKLNFTFKRPDGSPITSSDFPAATRGYVNLITPHGVYTDNEMSVEFSTNNLDANGRLSTDSGDLWPVGEGYVGSYSIPSVNIGSYMSIATYVNNGGVEEEWDGSFDGPGSKKDIIVYMIPVAETPTVGTLGDGWLRNDNRFVFQGSPPYNFPATPADGINKVAVVRPNPGTGRTTTRLQNNQPAYIYASKLFFETANNHINYEGLCLVVERNTNIYLNSSEIVMRGGVLIEFHNNNPGKIHLKTGINSIPGSSINDSRVDSNKSYGQIFLEGPVYYGTDKICEAGVYYFEDGTVLPDSGSLLIPITKENYFE